VPARRDGRIRAIEAVAEPEALDVALLRG